MSSLEQQIAKYQERNRAVQQRFLDNTTLNAKLIRTSNHSERNKLQNRAIKVRELKNSSLSYARHMNWLYHPYD